jgi:hypothetical protein
MILWFIEVINCFSGDIDTSLYIMSQHEGNQDQENQLIHNLIE